MQELTFSVFNHGPNALKKLQAVLKEFESLEKGVRVRLDVISWGLGWQKLMEYALYHIGADVSEVGNTWTADLVRMNALRPMPGREGLKGVEAYSIPWSADPHVVFYRRDMLQQIGIDEQEAFSSLVALDATLATLKKNGVENPLALATKTSRVCLHNLASWVWTSGGDFLSPDGLQVIFDSPVALQGIQSFFQLGKYIGDSGKKLEEYEADQLFLQGKAFMTIGGYWLMAMPENIKGKIGTVCAPQIPFCGGENLVLWKHSHQVEYAQKLIDFLTSSSHALDLFPQFGLPVREEGWQQGLFKEDLRYDAFYKAFKSGRSFSTDDLWGPVEKRLVDMVAENWLDVFKSPEQSDEFVKMAFSNLAASIRQSIKA